MNTKQHIPLLIVIGTAIIFTLGFRHYSSKKEHYKLFITETAQPHNIISSMTAPGILTPLEIIKIGNLINGIVRALYAEENDFVEEGQLLAEIDDSREDTDVNNAFSNLDAAQATLTYQNALLKRQEALFSRNQISLDLYQQSLRDYESSLAKVEQAKALYEQAKLVYDNKRIRTPISGIIIAKNTSIGEAVSNFSPSSVIYALAPHIKILKAHILLDNNAVETLKINTPVTMTVDTYPHKIFTGIITEITNMPHEMELTNYTYARLIPKTEKLARHCAIVSIDNSDLSLHPGMTFSAHITVAEKGNVLSVPNKVFKISKHDIQQLAEQLDYGYQPLENKELLEIAHAKTSKTLWIYKNKNFTEKVVTLGINDAEFFEVTEGLDSTQEIVYAIKDSRATK